jgi:hypothetical protein
MSGVPSSIPENLEAEPAKPRRGENLLDSLSCEAENSL